MSLGGTARPRTGMRVKKGTERCKFSKHLLFAFHLQKPGCDTWLIINVKQASTFALYRNYLQISLLAK